MYQDIVLKDFKWMNEQTVIDFDIWSNDDDDKPKLISECRIRANSRRGLHAQCQDELYTVWFSGEGFKSLTAPFNIVVAHLSEKRDHPSFKGNFVINPDSFGCKDCLIEPSRGLNDYSELQAFGDRINHVGLVIANMLPGSG